MLRKLSDEFLCFKNFQVLLEILIVFCMKQHLPFYWFIYQFLKGDRVTCHVFSKGLFCFVIMRIKHHRIINTES